MSRQLRRFNYTNRVKIAARDVRIDVHMREDGVPQATIREIDLTEHGRHTLSDWDSAQVVLEARRLSTGSFQRETIGTVGKLKESKGPLAVVSLGDFPDSEDITFRVKVVAGDKRLLADGDRIRIGELERADKNPLIEVYLVELGDEIWRVSWDDEEMGPRVLVNKDILYARGLLTHDPLTKGVIVPQIVREVLFRVVSDELDDREWATRWIEFAERYDKGDRPEPADTDGIQLWVDGIVAKFSTEHSFATRANEYLRSTGESM
jgi:hypothetical protein